VGASQAHLKIIETKGELATIFTTWGRREGPPKGLMRDTLVGPKDVIQAECLGRYFWTPAVSSDGVAIKVVRLRPRVLAA
jgi:hypothetical protein